MNIATSLQHLFGHLLAGDLYSVADGCGCCGCGCGWLVGWLVVVVDPL